MSDHQKRVHFSKSATIDRIENGGLLVSEKFVPEPLQPTGSPPMAMTHTRDIVQPNGNGEPDGEVDLDRDFLRVFNEMLDENFRIAAEVLR